MIESWEFLINGFRQDAIDAGNDPGRVDRAFEMVTSSQLGAALRKYGTTGETCTCADRLFGRARRCKHQLALIICQRFRRHFSEVEIGQ